MWSERKRKKVKCVWNRFKILGKQTSRNLTWAEVSDREARHSGEEREPRLAVCVKPPACRRVNRPRVTIDQGRGGRAMRHLICRPPQRPVNQFLSATQLTDTRRVITVRADAHQEAIREQKSRRAASPPLSPSSPNTYLCVSDSQASTNVRDGLYALSIITLFSHVYVLIVWLQRFEQKLRNVCRYVVLVIFMQKQ